MIEVHNRGLPIYYGYGWGDVDLKFVDATHIKWRYQPEDVILTNLNCPNGADLPKAKNLVFTKQ